MRRAANTRLPFRSTKQDVLHGAASSPSVRNLISSPLGVKPSISKKKKHSSFSFFIQPQAPQRRQPRIRGFNNDPGTRSSYTCYTHEGRATNTTHRLSLPSSCCRHSSRMYAVDAGVYRNMPEYARQRPRRRGPRWCAKNTECCHPLDRGHVVYEPHTSCEEVTKALIVRQRLIPLPFFLLARRQGNARAQTCIRVTETK